MARTGIRRSSHHHRAATGQEREKRNKEMKPDRENDSVEGRRKGGPRGECVGVVWTRQAGLEWNGMDGLWKPGGFSTER